ncbi:MAG: hypothetical protein WBB29_16700 [Geitlerinemataceae cyanobacterium]
MQLNPSKLPTSHVPTQSNLYLAFDGHCIEIVTNDDRALVWIEQNFGAFLVAEPRQIVDRLTVWREGEEYTLSVGNTAIVRGTLWEVLSPFKSEWLKCLIAARSDLMWLHAGGAAFGGKAVVFSGVSGRGKSTLVTGLCDRGWTYLSDDVLPLDPRSGKVIPFPLTPRVRQSVGEEVPPEAVDGLRRTQIDLKAEAISGEAMPISALIFPHYRHNGTTELVPYSPANAALELLQNCMNFCHHKQAGVRYLCQLLSELPTYRLWFSEGAEAAELVANLYKNL